MLCSHCGFYGHRHEACPRRATQRVEGVVNGERYEDEADTIVASPSKMDDVECNADDTWIVVQKARRPRKNNEKQGEQSGKVPAGSRFSALAVMDGGERMEMMTLPPNPFIFSEQGTNEENWSSKKLHRKSRRETKRKNESVAVAVGTELRTTKEVGVGSQEQMRHKRVDKRVRDGLELNMGGKSGGACVQREEDGLTN